ncbi:MAG: hypothetical protein A3K83_05675 [Omnitrophica WOR_2 bacterium RBG_13_44_8b]|nr:MAG: hypothetical protein A3K83_05675 [Omnitrophica WOR_2 bacterium RBG_13_44_8b]
MDFGLLRKALDEISKDRLADFIVFHVMGEPVLYPELARAIQYAKDKGLKIELSTNGSLMTEDMLDKLLEANTDYIVFSVLTPDEKSFIMRRAKMNFEEYKKHISTLIARALDKKSNSNIVLFFLTTPFGKLIFPSKEFSIINNKKDLVKHVNCWLPAILEKLSDKDVKNKIEANMVNLRTRLFELGMLAWNKFKITNNFFLQTRVLGDWIHRGSNIHNIHRASFGCCEGLTKHFSILWDGDMVFCCVDFDGKTKFNNIKRNTIKEALQEKGIQNYINEFNRLRIKHPYCQICLGDSSFLNAFVRQAGSIIYFKYFRRHWRKRWTKEESLVC